MVYKTGLPLRTRYVVYLLTEYCSCRANIVSRKGYKLEDYRQIEKSVTYGMWKLSVKREVNKP